MLKIKLIFPFYIAWSDYPTDDLHSIYLSCVGCDNNCINCQNKELQDYNYSKNVKIFTINTLYNELLEYTKRCKTKQIVLGGGDFLYFKNIEFTKEFVGTYKDEFDFCIYTGYSIEEVKQKGIYGFKYIKTGQYKEELKQESKKTDDYLQLASSNQEIYDSNFKLLSSNGRMYF